MLVVSSAQGSSNIKLLFLLGMAEETTEAQRGKQPAFEVLG